MRMTKYLFNAYKSVGFNVLRSCSSFSQPWLQPSTSKIKNEYDDDETLMVHAPAWDKLPIDILKLIFERLDLEDRIRFDLVCKQWRTNTTQTPQLLWLMLPYDENYQYLSFFDMSEGKVRKLNLPESAQGGWFCGCSKGWLFLAKGMEYHNLQIFLFDPISRVQIPLPPLSTISDFENSFTARRSKWNPAACIIAQVVVSSSDASQCIVAATFIDNGSLLALCRPQDERWTIVEGLLADEHRYARMLFSNGELYVCILSSDFEDQANNLGLLQTHSVTLGGRHEVNLKLIPFICPTIYPSVYAADVDEIIWYWKDWLLTPHLVESNGQLLMVTQISDNIRSWDYENFHEEDEDEDEDNRFLLNYYQTARFEVLKIQATDTIMCITRLINLGNQSLFVGDGVSVAAGDHYNEFDKNCIYFLEDTDYSTENAYPLSREAGVFYLDDGSLKRSFPSTKTEKGCFMSWFSPNIKTGTFS